MAQDFRADVENVSRIEAVPTILDVVCRTTGMRFAAVARVTDERWVACSVLDGIDFGLKPHGELSVETTICHEIRQSRDPVVIDNVAEDETWCRHRTPTMYGFQSYISVPIILADDSFFGTLCAIDPRPARLNNPETIGMFRLFADLIAKSLDAQQRLATTESALVAERGERELREQFIAVLGHDLRGPMTSISRLTDLLLKTPLDEGAITMVRLMRQSASRLLALIDSLLDLARGRLSGGLTLSRAGDEPLEAVLRTVIAELRVNHPEHVVETDFSLMHPIDCDRARIAQMFSNILSNALTYGSAGQPIRVRATSDEEGFELSVANAGTPIPPGALKHLFHPFYRSNAVQSQEGLGLGLYIAHEIARAHGGTLGVESTQQETRFTFRMPPIH